MNTATYGKIETAEPTNSKVAHDREGRSTEGRTATMAANNLLEIALEYAERGWQVIPLHSLTAHGCSCKRPGCESPCKHPRSEHGLKDASSDSATLKKWWTRWPDANIGIVTGPESGIFVLDIDGRQGEESLTALTCDRHLPETLTVRTGGGGRHFYFSWPNGVDVRNSVSTISNGVDVRGRGGYVLAPPSLHASGSRYEVIEPAAPPMPCPGWLLSLIQGPQGAGDRQSARAVGAAATTRIDEGGRNNHLVSLAGTMNKRGMAPDSIEAALLAENAAKCFPPLPEDNVKAIAHDIPARYPCNQRASEDDPRPPEYADDALAQKFTARHGTNLRYTAAWGFWSVWTGSVWKKDETSEVLWLAREVCRAESAACPGKESLAARIASAQTITAVVRLACADRRHAATIEQWDADPWLLNTPGGVVDLRNGELRPAQREDYHTKSAAVAPGGDCPTWLSFLDRVTAGDRALQAFMQRVCGYALTGLTREQALFFLYGTGANGKSVFVDTICTVMGSYVRTAPIETFIASRSQGHPTDLAGLQGARLVHRR